MDITVDCRGVDYEGLKVVIDKSRIRWEYQFEYLGRLFNVFPGKYTRTDRRAGEKPVFWMGNSSTADYDIYIATNVFKKEFRKPVLLHETLEAFLQEDFCRKFDYRTALTMAHEVAIQYDQRYAREILSDDLFGEYLQLRDRLTGLLG